MDKFNGLRLNQ